MKITFLILLTSIFSISTFSFFQEETIKKGVKIDKIVVLKAKRQLLVFSKGILLKTYAVSLGGQPIGAKEFEGDQKTPEGIYTINGKNANSDYHKNLGVSYPNSTDIKRAKQLKKPAGGDIKIHGLPNGMASIGKTHLLSDWTLGCIALTNQEIDELFKIVAIGTAIEIKK